MFQKIFGMSCLLLLSLFSIPAVAVDFGIYGYYRFRSDVTHDLDTQTNNPSIAHNNDRFGVIQFNQMRLRLGPALKINDHLSVHTELDIFDDLVFGSAANKNLQILSPVVGTLTLPAGAGTIGEVGGVAGENASIHMRRAWMEILTPVGKFRLGRQPSHWGLGIFQNDGDDRQGDFGDSQDRVLFLTQLALQDYSALTLGLVWDIPFEAQFDPRIQGLGGAVRDNGQDSQQLAAIMLFERPAWAIGTFVGTRFRDGAAGSTTTTAVDANNNTVNAGIDGDTTLFFVDLFGRYQYEEYTFKVEAVYIGGEISTGLAINAIQFSTFAGAGAGAGVISLPAEQELRVFMAALEVDAVYDWGGEWNVKAGYASGDETPLSTQITQYGFRPDYQVALMMFNRPLGTSPSLFGTTAGGVANTRLTGGVPITGNFINNAIYLSTGYKQELDVLSAIPNTNWFKLGGQVTTAWAPMRNVNLDFRQLLGNANLPALAETGGNILTRWYGVEVDFIAEAVFFDHLYTSTEMGFLFPGRAYNIDVNATDPGNIIDPIPVDRASFALAGRLSAMIEF